jgi:hypothetical protein
MKITAGILSIDLEPQLVNQQNVSMALQAIQQLVAMQTDRLASNLKPEPKVVEGVKDF